MIPAWPGKIAAGLIVLCVIGPLIAVFWVAGGGSALTPTDWVALRFTVKQALISAFFSCLFAIPVARALARQSFPGRRFVITLLGAPFLLPVIVAVLGLLAVFGRSGVLNSVLVWFGLPTVSIYGVHGVVLAHVFFNMPLATRILLQAWQDIPAERFRLVAGLNLSSGQVFRFIEWPLLCRALPGAFVLIFALCLSSFAVVLTLGGGPKATTIELAIYQAFRFDFDMGRAAVLASVQMAMAASVAAIALRFAAPNAMGAGLDRVLHRWDGQRGSVRFLDLATLGLAMLFLLGPMAMVLGNGVQALFDLPLNVWVAWGRSLGLAIGSTVIFLALALPVALASLHRAQYELIGLLGIVSSPLVLGTGMFVLLFPVIRPSDLTYVIVPLINAIMALPFALRVLVPAMREAEQSFGPLADQLGLVGWVRLRFLILPRARPALGFACGLTAALSMGDLGVVALFADPDQATLPLQMYRLMGAYRMEAAAGAGLLLLLSSFGLFWMLDWKGRQNAAA